MILAALVTLLLQQPPAPRPAAQQPRAPTTLAATQVGVTVSADTVRVGDPFIVRVRIRAPRGATVEFPLAPDTASKVELIDPRAVRPSEDSAAVDVTASYRAAAWDVGARPLGFGDAVVRLGTAERRVPIAARVFVASVLPADTAAARDPKPPRALFEPTVPWWKQWLPWIIAALVALLLLAWLWRRLRRRGAAALDPYAEAEAAFERVERLGLVAAGERGRHVALVVEVLRDYLARRVPVAQPSLTSTELSIALANNPAVPHARLAALLSAADLVKFAGQPIGGPEATALGHEARAIVRETEEATRRVEAERREAEAAEKRPVQVTTRRADEPPQAAA